jgi:glyoxylase-like metal-dependent hydrolase (beta-lactamase superfamily II)
VVVRADDVTYFLTGDATYSQHNLDAELTDGVTNGPTMALTTLRTIKAFAAVHPTVILPAHDPEGPARLTARAVYVPGSGGGIG